MFNRSSKKQPTMEIVEDEIPSNAAGDGGNSAESQPVALPTEAAMTGELERVRDLLFGRQTKALDNRLAGLESLIADIRRELTSLMEARFTELDKSFSSQLEALRKDALEYSDRQAAKQQAESQSVKQSLTERVDQQEKDQTEKLRSAQRALSERIDTLAADSSTELKKTQQELSTRIEAMNTEQSARIHHLQQETSQRDNALREELLALGNALGNQKVSRREMTQLLAELARRLQGEDAAS